MYTAQKKITALGLLLMIAMPLFFYVGVLVRQKMIQHHREDRLNTEILQTIALSAEELNWVEPGKEVMVYGRLFDVGSIKTEGNKIFLTGFFDGKEDKVLKHLNDLGLQKNESNNPYSQLAVKFLLVPAYPAQTEINTGGSWHHVPQQYCSSVEMIPAAPCIEFSPPPKI